jgi:hypothetical protein
MGRRDRTWPHHLGSLTGFCTARPRRENSRMTRLSLADARFSARDPVCEIAGNRSTTRCQIAGIPTSSLDRRATRPNGGDPLCGPWRMITIVAFPVRFPRFFRAWPAKSSHHHASPVLPVVNVRFWHKADIVIALSSVRFRVNSGHCPRR